MFDLNKFTWRDGCKIFVVCMIVSFMFIIACDESEQPLITSKAVKQEVIKVLDVSDNTVRKDELNRIYNRLGRRVNRLENSRTLPYNGYKALAMLYEVQVMILNQTEN